MKSFKHKIKIQLSKLGLYKAKRTPSPAGSQVIPTNEESAGFVPEGEEESVVKQDDNVVCNCFSIFSPVC